jgi:hypothetical protein
MYRPHTHLTHLTQHTHLRGRNRRTMRSSNRRRRTHTRKMPPITSRVMNTQRRSQVIIDCASNKLYKKLNEEILEMFDEEFEEIIKNENMNISQAKSILQNNVKIIIEAITNPGSIYVFGDKNHGTKLFEVLKIILPCLNPKQKSVLNKSHYFTETKSQFGDFLEHFTQPKPSLFPFDDLCSLNPPSRDREAEYLAKRMDMANKRWSDFIAKHLTEEGVNFISVGRTHLYKIKGILEEEEDWTNNEKKVELPSFQDTLKLKLPTKTIHSVIFVDFLQSHIVHENDEDIIKPVTEVTKFIY